MTSILEIRNLQFEYRGNGEGSIYVESLCVRDGGLLALLGSSGAGKTTILRLISGLLHQNHGSIKLGGVELSNRDSADREIGMVFQQPMLFPFLDVIGNVAFPLKLKGGSKAQVKQKAFEYLELVGMEHFANREICAISGGQAQRIALARALAASPKLLLLDEPFAALDVDVRAEMQELVARLRRELGLSMILVTHDQREAGLLADHVALLQDGKILQQGSISDLYRRPKSIQVFRAMGGTNEVPGYVKNGYFFSNLGKISVSDLDNVEGAAILTFRQETPAIRRLGESKSPGLIGKVLKSRAIGFRQEISIEVNGEQLRLETNSDSLYRPGEEIDVELDWAACNVIPVVETIRLKSLLNA